VAALLEQHGFGELAAGDEAFAPDGETTTTADPAPDRRSQLPQNG
jgi:hypothetical protein